MNSPILLDFAMPITSERLSIRPMQPGDGKQLLSQIDKNRDIIGKWLPWVDDIKTEIDCEINARKFYAEYILRKAFHFVMCIEGEIIGGIGINGINWTIGRMNIGYWCSVDYQGKGYVSEAVNAVSDFSFAHLKAQKLIIACDSENTKSIKVAERCQFVLEGEALGILDHPGNRSLRLGRRYARYGN